jgi:hypothetical protein
MAQDINEVYPTINSLDALSRGLDFPILLYIDVKPHDLYWNEILKELYGRKNLRFFGNNQTRGLEQDNFRI